MAMFLLGAHTPPPAKSHPFPPLRIALPNPRPQASVSSSPRSLLRKPRHPAPAWLAAPSSVHLHASAPSFTQPVESHRPLLKSPPASSGPISLDTKMYSEMVEPPIGFLPCHHAGGEVNAASVGSALNLHGYGAFFTVLYCPLKGDPAGTIAIWSYVAPELCNTTFFYDVSVKANVGVIDITIMYNGVGTITTRSQAIPLVSNQYTVAGPNWLEYQDDNGDVSYTYTGFNPSSRPYTVPMNLRHTPCGTPFATVINEQFVAAAQLQCDHVGNLKGWLLFGVGYQQDQCSGNGISDARVDTEGVQDSFGRSVGAVNLDVYQFSTSESAFS